MAEEHGQPAAGLECLVCMDDIDKDTYCEYQTSASPKWRSAWYCASCTQILLDTQYQQYMDSVQKSECAAELRRLMAKGPPVWLSDKNGYPIAEEAPEETHLTQLWRSSDGEVVTAKLKGALEGAERQQLWDHLKEFVAVKPQTEPDAE